MTELHTHRLDGCTPTPLASYLKALGILRLLASAANKVKGKAADSAARGWWAGEYFHLRTRLDRDALLRFFLEEYAPSPIIAPWNGGSGFYYREGKTGEKNPATGKMIKTGVRDAPTEATRRIDAIAGSGCPRLARLSEAINVARKVIGEFELREAPESKAGQKAEFIERYRSLTGEDATDWIDAAIAVAGEQFDSAPVLGSGGNDGNLDFSTAFQAAMLSLIDSATGIASAKAATALECALFNRAMTDAFSAGISQLAPGDIAAANSGNGFSGVERGDGWSIILMFEGAIAFAGSVTRRSAANRSRGSFPFTVVQSASGSGAVGGDDESSKRSAELWLPLWHRPASFCELRGLLSEGRAHLGRVEAKDGLTFARAVASLGVSRGIAEFARLGFEARYGNMFITVPLGRFITPKRQHGDLIDDLDADGWLSRIRRLAREETAPSRAREAIRRLEDTLFDLTREGREREGVGAALAALGGVVSWLTTSREAQMKVAPPPRLSHEWVRRADDGTTEFRIASALASLGWSSIGGLREQVEEQDSASALANITEGEASPSAEVPYNSLGIIAESEATKRKLPPPMAAHFAPVDERTVVHSSRRRGWAKDHPPTVVWGAGTLAQNMIAVLERRLIEQTLRGLDDKPLAGASPASLNDIATFLEGPPAFDDVRCAKLLSGLVWAIPRNFPSYLARASVPLAYAALKPLFTPDNQLRSKSVRDADERQFLSETGKLPIPAGFVARLRRGAVEEAMRIAFDRARASGIESPFNLARSAAVTRFGTAIEADRLAASLVIPIDAETLSYLMNRAYPKIGCKKETEDAA